MCKLKLRPNILVLQSTEEILAGKMIRDYFNRTTEVDNRCIYECNNEILVYGNIALVKTMIQNQKNVMLESVYYDLF